MERTMEVIAEGVGINDMDASDKISIPDADVRVGDIISFVRQNKSESSHHTTLVVTSVQHLFVHEYRIDQSTYSGKIVRCKEYQKD